MLETVAAPEPNGRPDGVWSINTARAESGEVTVAGVPVSLIAAQFGTPTYILDEADMRTRARAWVEAMEKAFTSLAGADVYYAGKAFLSKAVARWMMDEGLNIDAASEGELRTALAGGVPGSRIGLHGNNKSEAEIALAIDSGIAHIVIDSIPEIAKVACIASERGRSAPVYVRLTTGVHAGGHDFIQTAHEDQKFGLSVTSGAAYDAITQIAGTPGLKLMGIHSHIGSQILSTDGFAEAAKVVLDVRAWAAQRGIEIPEVDLGGGYGVRYTSQDAVPPAPEEFAEVLAQAVRAHCDATGLPAPRISIEPGRSIVAPAMMTLYTVGTMKDVATDSGPRRYISVDGGMSDNLRPALYGANYTAAVVGREATGAGCRSRVVGKHCESGDILVKDVSLPPVEIGDLLAVPVTGAYGRSMGSNYNMLPRPGVIAVRDGQCTVLLRRETIEDQLAYDLG